MSSLIKIAHRPTGCSQVYVNEPQRHFSVSVEATRKKKSHQHKLINTIFYFRVTALQTITQKRKKKPPKSTEDKKKPSER